MTELSNSETESTKSPVLSDTPLHLSASDESIDPKAKQNSSTNLKKHVRISEDLTPVEVFHGVEENADARGSEEYLPSFRKRPLSDTPVTSNWPSREASVNSTPLISPEESDISLNTLIEKEGNKLAPNITKLNNIKKTIEGKEFLPTGVNSPSKFSHPRKKRTTMDVPGLTKSKNSPNGITSGLDMGSKLIIIMVGLPATGKSFMTNKLSRYLNYTLYHCKVFNVGNTRRQYAKEHHLAEQDSHFFNPKNEECNALREQWAMDTLEEMMNWLLHDSGIVGIFDATNTTKERRKNIIAKIREKSKEIEVLFLETICSDKILVEKNMRLKLFGPDYKGKDPGSSLLDFKRRLKNYKTAYEPLEDKEGNSYIKLIDVGKKVITYKIKGYLASQTVYYLLNFTLRDRQIWITRSGESEDNVYGRIGGDSHLTSRGDGYSKALSSFISKQRALFNAKMLESQLADETIYGNFSDSDSEETSDNNNEDTTSKTSDEVEDEDNQLNEFFVWTSSRNRCVETVSNFDELEFPVKQMKMLDELNAGDFEGLTYSEIQANYPGEFELRHKDKLFYRYPGIGGESYMDVINRVKPIITEIERIEDNVLIVTHRVVARILLGYFLNLSKDIITNLDIPLHCVYCLETKPYGIDWALWEYDEEVNDFFKVPQNKLNLTKVKEVGLVYKERRYSIVPTAPPSAQSSAIETHLLPTCEEEEGDEDEDGRTTPNPSLASFDDDDDKSFDKASNNIFANYTGFDKNYNPGVSDSSRKAKIKMNNNTIDNILRKDYEEYDKKIPNNSIFSRIPKLPTSVPGTKRSSLTKDSFSKGLEMHALDEKLRELNIQRAKLHEMNSFSHHSMRNAKILDISNHNAHQKATFKQNTKDGDDGTAGQYERRPNLDTKHVEGGEHNHEKRSLSERSMNLLRRHSKN